SEGPPPPYAMTDHVEDLAALLAHLGIGRTAVVGLSIGGMIAQGLAALHPELVSALVLCDTAHKIGTEQSWNARIEAVRNRGIGSIADAVMKGWLAEGYRRPDNPDLIRCKLMLSRQDIEGYDGSCTAERDCDLTESPRALNLPVLVVVGEEDGSTPPDLVRSMAELIEGARFEIVKGAAHIPCIEQPAETARLIKDFLKSTIA